MKKSIFKTSLLVTLSTLFVACGSHNHTSVNKETQKQPQQSQKPAPQTKPQENSQDKAPQDSKQEKPNNHEQDPSSPIKEENSTQNGSTEAEKEQKPSKPEKLMNTENSADKKDEMRNTDTSKHNSSENMQSDMPDSMANNNRPKENSPQMPPKTENSNNMSNKDKGKEKEKEKEKENQTRNTSKHEEVPQSDKPSSPLPPHLPKQGDWSTKIYDSHGNNRNTYLDPKNLATSRNTSSTDIISLKLGENKGNQNSYQFNLLGVSDKESLFYGYRSYNVSYMDKDQKVYDLIQATNEKQINKEKILNNFNAHYKKSKGFLYMPFASLSDPSIEKYAPEYADINITYKDGKAIGQVTKTGDAKTTLFNITETETKKTTSDYTLTITPTEQETKIQTKESAQFEVYFLDSATKGDRKYITGSGSSTNKKWGGVFAAEKQNENKPSSSTSTRAE